MILPIGCVFINAKNDCGDVGKRHHFRQSVLDVVTRCLLQSSGALLSVTCIYIGSLIMCILWIRQKCSFLLYDHFFLTILVYLIR